MPSSRLTKAAGPRSLARQAKATGRLGFYLRWCEAGISDAEAKGLASWASHERDFARLLDTSTDLKTLCDTHSAERLRPVVAVLHTIHALGAVTPGPAERRERREREKAVTRTLSVLTTAIDTIERLPQVFITGDDRDHVLLALRNILWQAKMESWWLSGAWRDTTAPPGRAVTLPVPPPPRPRHRPKGAFGDGFSPWIYLLSTEITELQKRHDWVMVRNLLAHFLPGEYLQLTKVRARSRVKAFAESYAHDLDAFRAAQLARADRYFTLTAPEKR